MDGWYSEAGVTRDDVDLVTTMDQDPNYVIILSKNKTGADGIMLFYLKHSDNPHVVLSKLEGEN